MQEIAGHGHDCEWSLRYVRSALGRVPERHAWIAAQTEIIRSNRPDVVLNDCYTTTPAAARACGVAVVSVARCRFARDDVRREWLGDVQLVPHAPEWLSLSAPDLVYGRPAWAQRTAMTSAPVEPRPVVASLSTALPDPKQLRLVLDALAHVDAESVVCYPHPDAAAAGSSRVVAWADLDALLPAARVLVCHGGHGVICRAIMHGVPVVALETGAFYSRVYGSATESAGAGIHVRWRDQTVRAIREAVRRAIDDVRLRDGAAVLRRSFEALPDLADALSAAVP
jgi:UDP:flavonoid glycosyltransferase YjiC (YdhE family)